MSEPVTQLVITQESTEVVVSKTFFDLELSSPGPQGARGPQGAQGLPGGTGFVLDQVAPSATWLIQHNLGRYPAVTIIDSAGNLVLTDVFYSDLNTAVLTFASPTTGKAVCS